MRAAGAGTTGVYNVPMLVGMKKEPAAAINNQI
jgi:hypothetical protein